MRLSTPVKVAFGYLLLTVLLIVSVNYIYRQMKQLTQRNNIEELQNERRHLTHTIVSQLYAAEVVAQTLSAGQLDNYWSYRKAMKETKNSIDSLRSLLNDSIQLLRLDTVQILLTKKERNTRQLLTALQDNEPDKLYRQQVEELIQQQDSILGQQHIHKKVVTKKHTSYTVEKKKGFFKRLAAVFSPGKGDSTEVRNVIQEEYVDTLTEAYNLVDTVAHLLHGIQTKVYETRQQHTEQINKRIYLIQLAGTQLSVKVNQLLEDIEAEEQQATQLKIQKEQRVRKHSATIIAGIAVLSVVLALFFFALIWRDISKSNHYRKELEKAKQKAEDLLVAREKLMLTITHDIKAPVGSIIGYLDLLERLLTEKRACFYLSNMKNSAQHLLSLVTSLLDLHRLDVQKMDIHKVSFNPYELMESIYNCFLPIAEKKQLLLTKKLASPLNTSFMGDPFRIRQITENLLSNALKFTKEGKIELFAAYENAQLHFYVKDTGCGITPDEQKKIFQEFTRLHNAQEQEGFGLGLAITRKLVTLLSGNIRVESCINEGSCFHVFIPLGDPVQTNAANEERMIDLPNALRLLLIDDDSIQLNLTKSMLENLYHNSKEKPVIKCCTTSAELFSELKAHTYHLILTDIQMPEINGFELLQKIRKEVELEGQINAIPVIAITAREDIDENDFKKQGFTGCLHKPFSLYELYEAIHEVLKNSNCQLPGSNASAFTQVKESNTSSETLCFDDLLAFSADDEEAAKDIIQTFISETENSLKKIELSLEENDMHTLCNVAHKMLPTFTMIKANEILPALKWLEAQRNESKLSARAMEEGGKIEKYTQFVIKYTRKKYFAK